MIPLKPFDPAASKPAPKAAPSLPAVLPPAKPASAVAAVAPTPQSAFKRQMLVLGAGLAVAALGIVGAGLVAMNRRSSG
jgi:hypothetical protein